MTERMGKGLSSLLGDKKFAILENAKNELNINDIVINKNQPRKNFKEEELQELTNSIKKYGVLQPILVRKLNNNKYQIIAGERRYRASKLAGLKTIPAIIKDFNNEESFNLSIIENIQRENLNVIEEANAYKTLMNDYNYTHQDIADKVGKSRSHITNIIRLLTLPDVVLSHLINGDIEMGHARALINCDFVEDIIDHIVDNKLSVREVEKLVKNEGNFKKKQVKKEDDRVSLLIQNGFNCKISNKSISFKFNSIKELDSFINNLIK